ncbi:MAG: hypothetical protein IT379_30855, partial [Deltaproteobacteria bacterium]|nr:hypothetical protein [Deltaproteobacteria bacterium]
MDDAPIRSRAVELADGREWELELAHEIRARSPDGICVAMPRTELGRSVTLTSVWTDPVLQLLSEPRVVRLHLRPAELLVFKRWAGPPGMTRLLQTHTAHPFVVRMLIGLVATSAALFALRDPWLACLGAQLALCTLWGRWNPHRAILLVNAAFAIAAALTSLHWMLADLGRGFGWLLPPIALTCLAARWVRLFLLFAPAP